MSTPLGTTPRAALLARGFAELRRLGGVKPPREFVLMDRAAIGLGSVFVHLKAEINWHKLFHELVEGFDMQTLDRRQKAALKQAGIEPAY